MTKSYIAIDSLFLLENIEQRTEGLANSFPVRAFTQVYQTLSRQNTFQNSVFKH